MKSAMNRWAIVMVAVGLIFGMTATTASAFRGENIKSPEEIIADMKARLNLTDEQVSQIRPIVESNQEKRRAVFEKYRGNIRGNRSEFRSEMDAIRQEADQQLSGILSPDQMAELDKMREEWRDKAVDRRQKRRGGSAY